MGLARIVRHQSLPDGRSNIVVLGVGRAELISEHSEPSSSYREGRCRRLDDIRDETPINRITTEKVSQLRLAAMQVVHGRADLTEELQRLLTPDRDPAEVVDVLAHMCLRCAPDRLAYMNLSTFGERADHLLATLTTILYAKRDVAEG
jgi:Lon protease-like protein